MSDWGITAWMAQPALFPAGDGHADVSPQNGAVNARVTTPIRFVLYADPLPDPVTITVNGVQIYDGTAFGGGYVGLALKRFGRLYFLFRPSEPFAEDQRVDVATNTGLAWSFRTLRGTSTYPGNALLEPESWLLQPFDRFLDFEPVRQVFLQQVLRAPTPNRDNVAVRAIYQLAFDTEISAVLNPLFLPDRAALDVTIAAKRPTLELDPVLQAYAGRIDRGLEHLVGDGALTRDHRNSFADYRASMLYTYKVSAVAVLLFFARAVEAALNAGTIDDPRILTIDYNPLTVDDSMITL